MQTVLLFIGGLGGWEVFLIIAVLVLLFGAKKIPELAKGLGNGIREFKSATRQIQEDINASEPIVGNNPQSTAPRRPVDSPRSTINSR